MNKHIFGIIFIVLFAMISVVSAWPVTVTANVVYPGSHPSYFDITITSSSNPSQLPTGTYVGWCSDSEHTITPANGITFTAYSTLVTPIPPVGETEQWYKVNYIINNDAGKDWRSIQTTFWHYDGGIPSPNPLAPINSGHYTALITGADANPLFVPNCDQKYAIELFTSDVQTLFIEQTQSCPPVPEFPTMALPVGMLIGLVGLVFVIKIHEY